MGATPVPAPTAAPCSLHTRHAPPAAYSELHHVVPQAWQQLWQPTGKLAGVLWDPRTVPICPTGHRNVHWLLVRIVKAAYVDIPGGRVDDATIIAWATASARSQKTIPSRPNVNELATAQLALERWYGAGGLVKTLGDAGEWGEA